MEEYSRSGKRLSAIFPTKWSDTKTQINHIVRTYDMNDSLTRTDSCSYVLDSKDYPPKKFEWGAPIVETIIYKKNKKTISNSDGTYEFWYDRDHRIIKESIGSNTTQYTYENGKQILAKNGESQMINKYTQTGKLSCSYETQGKKTFDSTVYHYNSIDSLIKSETWTHDGKYSYFAYTYSYDEKNNLVSIKIKRTINGFTDQSEYMTEEFKYSSDNKPIEHIEYNYYGSGKPTTRDTTHFTRTIYSDSGYSVIDLHFNNGYMNQKNGRSNEFTIKYFNSKNKIVRVKNISIYGKVTSLGEVINYSYDVNGNITQVEVIEDTVGRRYGTKVTYDSKELPSTEEFYSSYNGEKDKFQFIKKYYYEFY